MPSDARDRPGAVILVGGHESDGGRTLPANLRIPSGSVSAATAAGRDLERALERARRAPDAGPVVVVPMTLGRDPRLVSDTARTVRWAARDADEATFALAPPFGTPDHLVSGLRAACRRLGDDETAVLITAPAADAFDDAELHRVAALVRTHAPHAIVEVGVRRPGDDVGPGLDRCRRLGASRVAVVPAEFGVPDGADGPLLSDSAIGAIVGARVATALHRLTHGDDGIAAAHDADHHHGFAHSHDADGHGHSHAHGHGHAHGAGPSPGTASTSEPAPSPGLGHRHDERAPASALGATHDHPDPHADDPLAVG